MVEQTTKHLGHLPQLDHHVEQVVECGVERRAGLLHVTEQDGGDQGLQQVRVVGVQAGHHVLQLREQLGGWELGAVVGGREGDGLLLAACASLSCTRVVMPLTCGSLRSE